MCVETGLKIEQDLETLSFSLMCVLNGYTVAAPELGAHCVHDVANDLDNRFWFIA